MLRDRLTEARKNNDGFTLIELLIVIVVLGILAGIVVLGLGSFRQDATTAACNADVKQVQIAVDAFMAKPSNTSGAAPTPLSDMTTLTTAAAPAKPLLKSAPSTTGIVWDANGDVTRTGGC